MKLADICKKYGVRAYSDVSKLYADESIQNIAHTDLGEEADEDGKERN